MLLLLSHPYSEDLYNYFIIDILDIGFRKVEVFQMRRDLSKRYRHGYSLDREDNDNNLI